MKIGKALIPALAAVGLLVIVAPAHAQCAAAIAAAIQAEVASIMAALIVATGIMAVGFFVRRGGVNVFVGAGFFGWPYWGYPYWGYPHYSPYGYYYPPPGYYAPASGGVYDGRVIKNDGGGKDASIAARVQQRLARTGYYDGPIDGVIGDGTRRAIRSYERANGLRIDGRIDDELLQAMGLG